MGKKLNWKLGLFFVLFVLFFLSLPQFLLANLGETTYLGFWEGTQRILYSGYNFWNLDYSDVSPSLVSSYKAGIIDTSLPFNSHLTIRGKKVIGIKYTYYNYLNPISEEDKPTSSTEIDQKLQIKASGKIGRKITVNLDYDDTAPRTEQQKVSLVYKGDEDEIIQEVALGDIYLSIPRTHFTSYDKSLFGVRLKAKWKDFYFTGIGSLTRGISEEKNFTGKTTTEEKEIPDISYIKRTYFKVFFDQEEKYPSEFFGPFSYTQGSVEVWIDDQDGSNNQTATKMTIEPVSGDSAYTGYFNRQYAGQDYIVDYPKGIIKFNKSISEQWVVALSYKDSGGNPHPDPSSGYNYHMMMKGPDEKYYRYRFWNWYYLGSQKINQDDFVFRIKNLAGEIVYDWKNPGGYPDYEVKIDFDFGIAQIVKPLTPVTAEVYYKPFPEAYPPTSLHRYILYTEYAHSVDIYLLRPDIIPESERVYVDERLLTRDEDYVIDYPSGYLSFLDPNLIDSDTEIRVEYEWAPIMGGEATFLGGRIEYRPSKNFSIGSTYLSQAATPSKKIPALGSSPISHQIWEADLHLDFEPNLGSLWGGDFPLKVLFSGEISQSNINSNTFGAGMLEDFSDSKVEDFLSLGKDAWKLGSKPLSVDPNARDKVIISDETLAGEEVNPSWSSDEITILDLTYDFGSGESWDSVIYSISSVGKDYSHMKYLEVWTDQISDDIEVYLDIGLVSEDVDGDGELDSEDENSDGVLNLGEDTGIVMNFPSGEEVIGADNGELDTEDLDRDEILDTTESFSTYFLSDDYKEATSTGWYKYTISLEDDVFAGQSWDEVKTLVKNIRLWAKGSEFSGAIKFAKIGIFGDRWEISDPDAIKIKGVDNYDDFDFPNPFENPDFYSYYENMYGDARTSEGKWRKETALSISGQTGYIQETFTSTKSFADYRQINFWLYQTSGEGELDFKFGSDVDTSFYSYTLPLSSVTTDSWVKVQIPFFNSQLEAVGSPTFREINQIRIELNGVLDFSPLYVDDIYLSEVYEESGLAQRYLLKTDWSKYFTLSAEYKKIDPPFSVIGGSTTNDVLELKKVDFSSSYLNFLPFAYSRSEEYTSTLTTQGTDLIVLEKDKALKKSQSYSLGFRLRSWPILTFKSSDTISDYFSEKPPEKTYEDVYDLSYNYSVPLKFALLPSNISTSFQLKKSGEEVEGTSSSTDITRKGSITLPFQPLPNMVLKTSYSQSDTSRSENEAEELPKLRSKDLSFNLQASFFRLTPKVDFKSKCTEEEFSISDPAQRKVSTNLDLSCTLPFRPASFVKIPEIFSTLGWYLSFNLKREGVYENTTSPLGLSSQFAFARFNLFDGEEKLWFEKRAFSVRQNWQPFSYLKTTISYGREEEDRTESGTPFVIRVESWPVVQCKLNLNHAPFFIDRLFQMFFSSSDLVLDYSRKNTLKEQISTTISYQPSLSWRGIFKKPRNLSLTYSYKTSIHNQKTYPGSEVEQELSFTHQLKLSHSYSTYISWGTRIP